MTGYREEVNAGTPNEWGEFVREEADEAAKLCDKYGIKYELMQIWADEYFDTDEEIERAGVKFGQSRTLYSDGTEGEWE